MRKAEKKEAKGIVQNLRSDFGYKLHHHNPQASWGKTLRLIRSRGSSEFIITFIFLVARWLVLGKIAIQIRMAA